MKLTQYCIIILLISICMSACKGTQQQAEPDIISILVLLKDNAKIDGIEALKGVNIIKKNRTSRSQNLWKVQVKEYKEKLENIVSEINKDPSVKWAKISTPAIPGKATNSKNVY